MEIISIIGNIYCVLKTYDNIQNVYSLTNAYICLIYVKYVYLFIININNG